MPASDTGALEYLIPVVYAAAAHTLNIVHPVIAVRPGDRVIWVFEGLPDGWAPWIQLKGEEGARPFLGPFQSLTQIEGGLSGIVSSALPSLPASFTYRATAQKGLGLDWQTDTAVLSSAQATIEVHDEAAPSAVSFRVFEIESGKLGVAPEMQSVQSGQTVLWTFEDLPDTPEAWRPRIDFGLYDGTGTVPNRLLGPFTCLVYEKGKVTGLGNSGVTGGYHFQVSLISVSTGNVVWLSSGDPVIDNRGPIWDPVSGGPSG